MSDQYDTWKQLLELKKANPTVGGMRNAIIAAGIQILETEPISGFYRSRMSKTGPLEPVAIWRDEAGNLSVFRGNDPVQLERVWPYCVSNPIPHEWYEAVTERGEGWPDMDATVATQVAEQAERAADSAEADRFGIGGNAPPDEATLLKEQIESAKAGAAQYVKIEDDETQARAQSLRSRMLELARTADKKWAAEVAPHEEVVEKIKSKWKPLVTMAKGTADAIRTAMNVWENEKLRREREAQRKADEERRRIEEENRKAAEKAAAENRPAPPPVEIPAAPPPAQPTAIKGAYGRAAGKKLKQIAVVNDLDKAFQHFRAFPEIKELIQRLAQRAVDAGQKDIPGVSIDERRDVA